MTSISIEITESVVACLLVQMCTVLMQVVETCHNAGISKLDVKLRPIAVIKG